MLSKARFYTSYIALLLFALMFLWMAVHSFRRGDVLFGCQLLALTLFIASDVRRNGLYTRPISEWRDLTPFRTPSPLPVRILRGTAIAVLAVTNLFVLIRAMGWSATFLTLLALIGCYHLPGRWRLPACAAVGLLAMLAIFEYGGTPRGL